MNRKIRFAMKAVLQPVQFEAIHIELEEQIEVPDDDQVNSARRRLINTVETELEREVLKTREDIAAAKRRQERRRRE
jgi:hypothetical protein